MTPNALTDWRTYVAGFAFALFAAWVYWPALKAEWARWKR